MSHTVIYNNAIELNVLNSISGLLGVITVQYIYSRYYHVVLPYLQYNSTQRIQLQQYKQHIAELQSQLIQYNHTSEYIQYTQIQRKLQATEKQYKTICGMVRFNRLYCNIVIQLVRISTLLLIAFLVHTYSTAHVFHILYNNNNNNITPYHTLHNIIPFKYFINDINIITWMYICHYVVSQYLV